GRGPHRRRALGSRRLQGADRMAEVTAGGSRPSIVFIGFMASGKTRAAEEVAQRLGTAAVDVDELLVDELGEPIASFFEREGETEFRRREEELTLRLLDGEAPEVMALGGGSVESEPGR